MFAQLFRKPAHPGKPPSLAELEKCLDKRFQELTEMLEETATARKKVGAAMRAARRDIRTLVDADTAHRQLLVSLRGYRHPKMSIATSIPDTEDIPESYHSPCVVDFQECDDIAKKHHELLLAEQSASVPQETRYRMAYKHFCSDGGPFYPPDSIPDVPSLFEKRLNLIGSGTFKMEKKKRIAEEMLGLIRKIHPGFGVHDLGKLGSDCYPTYIESKGPLEGSAGSIELNVDHKFDVMLLLMGRFE